MLASARPEAATHRSPGGADRLALACFLCLAFGFVYGPAALNMGGGAIGSPSSVPEWLGVAALGVTVWRFGGGAVLDAGDWLAIGVAALLLIHPAPWSPALALTVAGLRLAFGRRERVRTAGRLCLGFSWVYLWGALLFNGLAPWLLPLETALAFIPLAFVQTFKLSGATIEAANGFSVVVLPACSAFSNTVRTAFMWLALCAFLDIGVNGRVARYLAASIALVVLVNSARIALMATSYDHYRYWHDGAGEVWFSALLLASCLVPFYLMAVQTRQSHD